VSWSGTCGGTLCHCSATYGAMAPGMCY
jgi:hypothetical protein